MAREDEQRLRDMLRAIEAGETPEDIADPEEYDDMGGIKSLQKAPSIKMASETPGEEFDLEIMMMLKEFEDAKKNGYDGSLEDFSKFYFSKREEMKNRQMAMNGGRMQYADGKRAYEEVIDKDAEEEYYKAKAEQLDRKYNPQNYPESERNLSMEQIKKLLKKQEEEKVKRATGGIAGVL
jgi:hypothetical protein